MAKLEHPKGIIMEKPNMDWGKFGRVMNNTFPDKDKPIPKSLNEILTDKGFTKEQIGIVTDALRDTCSICYGGLPCYCGRDE
jgi:hypothetical protein